MFCTNCGAQIPDTATFCPSCGAQVPNAAVIPAEIPSTPQAPAETTPEYQAPTYEAPTYQQPYQQSGYQQAPQQPTYQEQPYQQQASQQPTYQQQPYQQQSYQQQSYQQPGYQQQPNQQANAQVAPLMPALPKSFSMPSVGDLFCGLRADVTSYAESYGVQMKWQKALAILLYLGVLSSIVTAFRYFTGAIYDGSASFVYSTFPAMRILDILYGVFCIAYAAGILYTRMLLAKYKADGPKFFLFLILCNGAASIVMALLTGVVTGVHDFPTLVGQVVGIAVAFTLNRIYFQKRMFLFSE